MMDSVATEDDFVSSFVDDEGWGRTWGIASCGRDE